MKMKDLAALALLTAAVVGGCRESDDDGFGLDATGTIEGLAWVDRNGNGTLESSDGPARNVQVDFVPASGGQAMYTAETNSNGEFSLSDVMVGDYRAVVDSGSVGDTLRILRVDSADLTVAAEGISTVLVGLTYPTLSTDSARAAPLEQRFFVEGTVLADWNNFGDEALHVRDSTGAIRAVRVPASSASAGDSVRLLAVTSAQAGSPVLRDVVVFLLRAGVESPDPVLVSTSAAADADGGELDADLVRVENATVQDTVRNALGEPVLQVDDGSGQLDIVLDREIPFFLSVPGGGDLIGAVIDATGLLVPPVSGASGVWVLKPRQNLDLTVRAP